jgi:hypothetical protein
VEAHRFRRDFLHSSRAGPDRPTRPEPPSPFAGQPSSTTTASIQDYGRCAGPNRCLVETISHRDVIQREISKGSRLARFSLTGTESLGPQPLAKHAVLGTAEEIFVLDNAFALIEGRPLCDR